MDSHLFLDAGANHVVGLPRAAVLVDPDFGNKEDGDALGAGRVPLNPGQYRMDNIVRQVMFAIGDKDFVSADGIGSVGIFDGNGRQGPHIGARLGFGQQHGAAPLAGIQLL